MISSSTRTSSPTTTPRRNFHLTGVRHPKLTGYRLLFIILTLSFGLSKAALAYQGQSVSPTTLEWIFGVVIGLALYWLSLYENDANAYLMPWLFEFDYYNPIAHGLCSSSTFLHTALNMIA
ncbi:hypothetical protein BD410DRAFT_843030 [Rickenella mellea]|uniref:Uncharacterized protein n=1 Tax=Rickenella mellea TaxID=50990 RepID=A0A4Y7PS30_9AGAM|nr:hypothetical protein BD410DRAFT_843030 [Rickenella mellea]